MSNFIKDMETILLMTQVYFHKGFFCVCQLVKIKRIRPTYIDLLFYFRHSDNGVKMNRRRSEVVTKTEKFGHQLEVQQNQLHHRRRRSSGRKMSDN